MWLLVVLPTMKRVSQGMKAITSFHNYLHQGVTEFVPHFKQRYDHNSLRNDLYQKLLVQNLKALFSRLRRYIL
jgi:hypothetical protein